jgi:hypothetical protein
MYELASCLVFKGISSRVLGVMQERFLDYSTSGVNQRVRVVEKVDQPIVITTLMVDPSQIGGMSTRWSGCFIDCPWLEGVVGEHRVEVRIVGIHLRSLNSQLARLAAILFSSVS